MTAAELAAELEVSVRTIYRDLEALGRAHVPVVTERGPGGGCRLLGGYRTHLTGLSREEAEALYLAGVPAAAAELGLGSLLAVAQLKLAAALPDRVRDAARLAQQRFHVDVSGWFETPAPRAELAQVARAVFQDRRIELRYRRADGALVERRLDPLGVVLKSGLWYLIARVDGALRTYRVSRIERIAVLEEGFARPVHFDLAAFWAEASRAFEGGLEYFPVTVRLSPAGLERISLLGEASRRAPPGPDPASDPDGWQRRTLAFERLEWAESMLLRLGPEVEVIEPASLRARMRSASRGLARLYGVTRGRRSGGRAQSPRA
jgi:predicted DNA-binding transcriptional regulator YafY